MEEQVDGAVAATVATTVVGDETNAPASDELQRITQQHLDSGNDTRRARWRRGRLLHGMRARGRRRRSADQGKCETCQPRVLEPGPPPRPTRRRSATSGKRHRMVHAVAQNVELHLTKTRKRNCDLIRSIGGAYWRRVDGQQDVACPQCVSRPLGHVEYKQSTLAPLSEI